MRCRQVNWIFPSIYDQKNCLFEDENDWKAEDNNDDNEYTEGGEEVSLLDKCGEYFFLSMVLSTKHKNYFRTNLFYKIINSTKLDTLHTSQIVPIITNLYVNK